MTVTAATTVLTERERTILGYVAEGESNADIGRALYLAEDTVKAHLRRIFRKLGARDRAHAVTLAARQQQPATPTPPALSRGGLDAVIARWEGRIPRALLAELRAVANPAATP